MSYINYKIKSNKDKSTFYISSKDKIEGYVEVQIKDRGTFYHKYLSNISGVLETIKMRDGKFGQTLELYLKQDNGDIGVLSTNIFRNTSSVDDFTKSLIRILDNLKKGEKYEFFLNNKSKDKKEFLYKTIYASKINGEDKEKIEWSFENSEVPAGEKVKHPVTGVESWNFDKHNAFYYNKLKSFIESNTPNTDYNKVAEEALGLAEDTNTEDDVNSEDIPFK